MPDTGPESLAFVILNWNGAGDTLACLQSLRASTVPVHLLVVDNGSTDGSVAAIESSRLADTVISTRTNLGYAGGNNIGLSRALGDGFDVVCVLNNDTVAPPDFAEKLLAALPRERALAVSPDIRYHDDPERSWFLGGALQRGWAFHFKPEEQRAGPTQFLSGCCIAARREVWAKVGLFDESFFLTFEDADWSLRAGSLGVDLATVADATLLHKLSRSFASSETARRLAGFYFARNGMRVAWRWDRRHCLAFMLRQVVRPSLRDLVRTRRRDPLFSFVGIAAFWLGQRGAAPRLLAWLAEGGPGKRRG
ncbi:MAG TPA: glycosyltransferase family 2 protein [Gaiellaceae bacterium]|nr:glycosyltransferase family 2 protein [Gaiellaceae bacterium]